MLQPLIEGLGIMSQAPAWRTAFGKSRTDESAIIILGKVVRALISPFAERTILMVLLRLVPGLVMTRYCVGLDPFSSKATVKPIRPTIPNMHAGKKS